jgi:hypothetical protein
MACECDMGGRGKACHCRACCLTFSGVSAFDRHIVGGVHVAPAGRGLVLVRADVWGWPDSGRRIELPRQAGPSEGERGDTVGVAVAGV